MHTSTHTHGLVDVPKLDIDVTRIPPLIDVVGVSTYLAPLSRSLLYELASRGEIQSASIGLKRGRRFFVTTSLVSWLQKRASGTQRPNIAPRKKEKKAEARNDREQASK